MAEGRADESLSSGFEVASKDSLETTSGLGKREKRAADKMGKLEHLKGKFFEVRLVFFQYGDDEVIPHCM